MKVILNGSLIEFVERSLCFHPCKLLNCGRLWDHLVNLTDI